MIGKERQRPDREPAGPAVSKGPASAGAAAADDPSARAKSDALRLLSFRPRSRSELEKRLIEKGHSSEIAERTVRMLGQLGLVDDAKIAAMVAASRSVSAGVGRQRIAQDLRRRGFSDRAVREAVAGVQEEDERRSAEELLLRRLAKLGGSPPDKRRARLYGLLRRRGFAESIIYGLFDKHLRADA